MTSPTSSGRSWPRQLRASLLGFFRQGSFAHHQPQFAAPAPSATLRWGSGIAIARHEAFLSTAAARRSDWQIAAAVVIASIVGLVLATPYADLRWPVTPSFIAAYEATIIVANLVTAVLLMGQFRQLRHVSVLIIASGYLFCAVIVAAHGLTFPGVFSATGLLGAGRQSSPWLYVLWHGIFPLFICAYALVARSKWDLHLDEDRVGLAVLVGIAGAVGIAMASTLLSTTGVHWLPEIILDNNYRRLVTSGIGPGTWLIGAAALACLWVRTKGRTILDLWLLLVMIAWLLDILLTALISSVRYDFGWYAGRTYGLVAASVVLTALLLEANHLYGRLVLSLGQTREKNADLERLNESLVRNNAALQAAVSELDAFSYSVSHDLRAPLRAIDGFSQILLKQYAAELPSEPRDLLLSVRKNALRMGRLVDDLLEFARLSRAHMSTQSVATGSIVEDVVREAQTGAEDRAVTVTVGTLPPLHGDAALIKQIFVNLISNAFKYTRLTGHAAVEIGSKDIGGEHVIFVRDNGAGFDMKYAGKLFGVFQRMHRAEDFEGTGVGLAIVQRIVQRHGGRVWAEAAVNEGATFFFTLQAANHG